MRIVGKVKNDYYDSCVGHGFDPNVVYVRDSFEYSDDHDFFKHVCGLKSADYKYRDGVYLGFRGETKGKKVTFEYDTGMVGFCGTIFPYVRVRRKARTYPTYQEGETQYFYDKKSANDYLKQYGAGPLVSDTWWDRQYGDSRVDEFFERVNDMDFFFEFGQPAFAYMYVGYERKLVANPVLKELQFYKVFDAYATFQELSMFLGGVLGAAHPPMVEISDEEMAVKKGHGGKYSFRQPPGQKTRKGKR